MRHRIIICQIYIKIRTIKERSRTSNSDVRKEDTTKTVNCGWFFVLSSKFGPIIMAAFSDKKFPELILDDHSPCNSIQNTLELSSHTMPYYELKCSDTESASISSVLIRVDLDLETEHFNVEHKMRNPFVMILGVTTYKGQKSSGWKHLPGVEQDVQHMKHLWQQILHFDTKILTDSYNKKYANCSRKDILAFRNKCQQEIIDADPASTMYSMQAHMNTNTDTKRYDGLICIVSGHGLLNKLIAGDGEEIDINTNFFVDFNADHLETLANYPKLFLLDTCRGGEPAHIKEKFINVKGRELISCNVEDGYRISYATTPTKTAIDDQQQGGYFLKAFYDVMTYLYGNKILHTTDFQTILRMTSQKAKIRSGEWLCPVHEDYTNYKIFIRCKYSKSHRDAKDGKDGIILKQYSLNKIVKIKSLQEQKRRDADKAELDMDELKSWFEDVVKLPECKIDEYYDVFKQNDIDELWKVEKMNEEMLNKIGKHGELITFGHHMEIWKCIEDLQAENAPLPACTGTGTGNEQKEEIFMHVYLWMWKERY